MQRETLLVQKRKWFPAEPKSLQSELWSWISVLAFAVLYGIAAVLSLHFAVNDTNISPVWLASGVGLGAYILVGNRMLVGIWFAALSTNILGFQRLDRLTDASSILLSAWLACGNTFEPWLGKTFGQCLHSLSVRFFPDQYDIQDRLDHDTREASARPWNLADARSVSVFVVAMFLACVSCAVIGTWGHWLFSAIPATNSVQQLVYIWWSGDLLGMILIAPAFIVFKNASASDWKSITRFTASITYFVLISSAMICFGGLPDLDTQCLLACLIPVVTVILPFVVPRNGVVIGNLSVAAAAMLGTYYGIGPLAWRKSSNSWLLLQTYIGVNTLIGFLVSALVSQSNVLAVRLARMRVKETEEVYKQRLKESSQRLNETSADLRGILGAFPDIYFWLDPDGTFRRYFSTVPTYIPSEAFLNRTIQEIMPSSVSAMLVDALRKATQTSAIVEVDYPLETNGKVGWYEARLQQLESGQVLAIIRDITSRKKAESRLEELLREREEIAQVHSQRSVELARSNAELEQFAYVASHDLREPLRMIRSFCSILKEKYGEALDDKGKEYLGYAADGAKRMQFMVDDLLEYSRAGKGEYRLECVCLRSIVLQVIENLRTSIEESHASIEYLDLPAITGDVQRVTQLFQNLISNSIKFCGDRPPKITISCTKSVDHWKVRVQDNGIGIDSQYYDRVFLMFQRLHCRKQYHGTGVGLAICKRIVEQHGGTIWIESVVGNGTSVIFTIPFSVSATRVKSDEIYV